MRIAAIVLCVTVGACGKADPEIAIPDLDVSEAHARDMAAYLATLK